tara:strand:- start:2435 stop:4054 length:1620 start_codon:yes stop_codon:yes gene_type:complete
MARYSQVKFYEDMKKALAPSKVKPIKYARPPTSIGSDIEAAAKVGEEWLAAYLAKQKKDAEAADIKAAGAMLDKFYAPQEEWNEEEYGSTPDTLRAATMPGALTADVGSQEMPIESYGAMGPDGMPAALGAPNAALGAPIDIEQPYAVGTDEEGDDANWMSALEHAEFYEKAAAEAQAGFDVDNVPGLPAVMKADRGGAYNTANGVRGPRSNAMLAALRGEGRALEMEEAERDRTLTADNLKYQRDLAAATLAASRAKELKRTPSGTPKPAKTVTTAAGVFILNADGSLGRKLGDAPGLAGVLPNNGGSPGSNNGTTPSEPTVSSSGWIIPKTPKPWIKMGPKAQGQAEIAYQKRTETRLAKLREDLGAARKLSIGMKRFKILNAKQSTGGVTDRFLPEAITTDDEKKEMISITDNFTPLMRQGLPGAASEKDVQMFKSGLPGISRNRAVNDKLADALIRRAENAEAYKNYLEQYNSTNGHLEGADILWSEYLEANPIFNHSAESGELQLNEKRYSAKDYFIQQDNLARAKKALRKLGS